MSDNKTQPKLGHLHDLAPAEIAIFFMSMFREGVNDAGKQETKHLASGTGSLLFGVDGDQITVAFKTTKPNSTLDPNLYTEGGKLDVNAAERIIRALITLVQQAKKNAIDMPSPFGIAYTGLPLMPKEGE